MYRRLRRSALPVTQFHPYLAALPKDPLYYMDARNLAQVVAALMLGPSILYFVCRYGESCPVRLPSAPQLRGGLPQR
jgi:hypothetical protein